MIKMNILLFEPAAYGQSLLYAFPGKRRILPSLTAFLHVEFCLSVTDQIYFLFHILIIKKKALFLSTNIIFY